MPANPFLTSEYFERIPQWHAEDSTWKSQGVLRMLERNKLSPRRIGEVGCGTGAVLQQLQMQMERHCQFVGYDIAPEAIELSRTRQNDRLQCRLGNAAQEHDARFDVLLVLDVLEHQENYFSFLREIKPLAPYKLIHQVLDLSVQSVARREVLTRCRRKLCDLHFFTKDLVFEALRGEGYEVIDWFYGSPRRHQAAGVMATVKQLPRTLCFALNQDLTVRVLGGHSLFVLAK
jgi:ubiquinone/menaquinone biosynthesis C-methylase UbiE